MSVKLMHLLHYKMCSLLAINPSSLSTVVPYMQSNVYSSDVPRFFSRYSPKVGRRRVRGERTSTSHLSEGMKESSGLSGDKGSTRVDT